MTNGSERLTLRLSFLVAPLDRSLAQLSPLFLGEQEVRRLRWFWLDGMFAMVSTSFYGSFISLFAVAVGASNVQVGQLTAVASLCAMLALLPAARAISLLGGRRKIVVILFGGIIARVPIAVWALAPLLLGHPGGVALAVTTIILVNAVITAGANLAFPAWTATAADIVPQDIRGSYFGHRNLGVNVAGLFIVPLAGWLIQAINRPAAPLAGYQTVFVLALLSGLFATFMYSRIQDPQPTGKVAGGLRLPEVARILRAAPGFLPLVGCIFIWNFGLQVCAPFMNLYLVHDLGADTTIVGWVTAASSLTSMLTSAWLGRAVDRKGSVWMQGVMSFLVPFTPLLWIAAHHAWQVIFVNALGGFLWTAYNLAGFNLVLEMAPQNVRTEAVALSQFVVAAAAVCAPMLGGYLADSHGYRLIIAISAGVRFIAALAFLWWIARPISRRAKPVAART